MRKRRLFTNSQLWFLVIVLNACLVVLGTIFLSRYRNNQGNNAAETIEIIKNERSSPKYYATPTFQPESFTFDPNEADSTQLLRLGLAPFQVRSIYRYRAKGGRFSTKDDFRRVYRLTNEQWDHLEPLIRISHKYQLVEIKESRHNNLKPASRNTTTTDTTHTAGSQADHDTLLAEKAPRIYPQKFTGEETVDINTADSALLCRIPGIGAHFSRKIVQYRNKLGGYTSTAQLLLIEDFPADAIAWMVVADSTSVQPLRINHLTTRKLMKHPYMGYYRASEIENYRRVHGPIQSIEVLRKMKHFTEADIQRLKPYISFE